jgi:predicted nucleic acid-binding protein
MQIQTPDASVLVAAYRADHPHHGPAREWLEAQVRATAEGFRLLLLPMVCVLLVRLVTHPDAHELTLLSTA